MHFTRSTRPSQRARSGQAGKQRDSESGLDYFGARYDSSSLGRFITADWSSVPVAVPYATLTNPQSLNLYTYVGNNPVTDVDADGHAKEANQAAPGSDCEGSMECEQQAQQAANGTPPTAQQQNQNQLTPGQQRLVGALAYSETTTGTQAEQEAIISVVVNRADSGDRQYVNRGQAVNVENVANATAPNGQREFQGVGGRNFNAFLNGPPNNPGARNAAAAAANISQHGPTNHATAFLVTRGQAPTQRQVHNLGHVHFVGRVGNVFLYAPGTQ